mgnify:FL=1
MREQHAYIVVTNANRQSDHGFNVVRWETVVFIEILGGPRICDLIGIVQMYNM